MDANISVNLNIELTYRRQQVILQMRELEAATETITRAFEDEDFQNEAASARYKNLPILYKRNITVPSPDMSWHGS